jgi:hypothetical protein
MDCATLRERILETGTVASDPEVETHLVGCPACASLTRMSALVDDGLAILASEPIEPPSFEGLRAPARHAARNRRWRASGRRALPAATLATCAALCAALFVHFAGRPHVEPPRLYRAGDVIDSSAGSQTGVLPDDSRLTVESGRVSIEMATRIEERIRLETGTLSLDVPKHANGKVVVETTDTDVQVHGTRFTVTRQAEGTWVAVTEGTVEVLPRGQGRPILSVPAGQSVTIEPLASFRSRTRQTALDALQRGDLTAADEHVKALLATGVTQEDAGELHALLGWKHFEDGDHAGAARYFHMALAELPDGAVPLWADNAWAQSALVVEQSDGRAAAEAWRQYLRRFPSGSHASLARARLVRLTRGR